MSLRLAMLVHHYFPRDVRVRREARALAAAGHQVSVLCLRRPGEPAEEHWRGIRILRQPVGRHRGRGLAVYLAEYAAMTGLAAARLARLLLRQRFDAIHVHAPPDFLLAAALPALLRGARLVLDVHDLSPELYGERFGGRGGALAAEALEAVERAACARAERVITVTEAFAERLRRRGVAAEKIEVLRNGPDEEIFVPPAARPQRPPGALRLIHHGTLVQRYGVDVLLEALARLAPELDELRLDVFGEGDREPALRARAARPDLAGRVYFHGDVLQDELVGALAAADVCVVPNRADPFTDLLLPTKLLEGLRMGCACVASDTSVVRASLPDDALLRVPPGDAAALAAALRQLALDPAARRRLAAAGQRAAERFSWRREKQKLLALYAELGQA